MRVRVAQALATAMRVGARRRAEVGVLRRERSGGGGATIGWVLGKPPARSPVIAEAIGRLHHFRVETRVLVPDDPAAVTAVVAWSPPPDLVVVRGLRTPTLRALDRFAGGAVRFADRPSALAAVSDRAWVLARVAVAGVATPAYQRAGSWSQVLAATAGGPAVVKHLDGEVGRGARVLDAPTGELPATPPFPGPYLVEERIDRAGPEHKLYRFGRHVAAATVGDGGGPVAVTPSLAALAARVGDAVGLTSCGIDVLDGPSGPTVVDVNAFPSARRVAGSAVLITDHLLDLLADDHGT